MAGPSELVAWEGAHRGSWGLSQQLQGPEVQVLTAGRQGSAGEGWFETLGSLSLSPLFQSSREVEETEAKTERLCNLWGGKAGAHIHQYTVFRAHMPSLSFSTVATRHSAMLARAGPRGWDSGLGPPPIPTADMLACFNKWLSTRGDFRRCLATSGDTFYYHNLELGVGPLLATSGLRSGILLYPCSAQDTPTTKDYPAPSVNHLDIQIPLF